MNFIKSKIIGILKNIVRVGKISSIDYDHGTVKVVFPDKNNVVSSNLPYLSFEYNMPDIGDTVLCVFLPNGIARGFCLGKFYNKNNMPKEPGEQYYYKNIYDECNIKYDKEKKTYTLFSKNVVIETESIIFDFVREEDDSYIQYNPDTKTLTFLTKNIVFDGEVSINGNVSIEGNLNVDGNINATGSITDTTGNTNHHTHS